MARGGSVCVSAQGYGGRPDLVWRRHVFTISNDVPRRGWVGEHSPYFGEPVWHFLVLNAHVPFNPLQRVTGGAEVILVSTWCYLWDR